MLKTQPPHVFLPGADPSSGSPAKGKDHVKAALVAEKDVPVGLRLVTRMTERKAWNSCKPGDKVTSLGFLRLVTTLLPDEDRVKEESGLQPSARWRSSPLWTRTVWIR